MVNLSALFLSLKRLAEVIEIPGGYSASAIQEIPTDGMQRLAVISGLEQSVLKWLALREIPTLGELLTTAHHRQGSVFTHIASFFGRNISNAAVRFAEKKPLKTAPILWTKLDSFFPKATLTVQAHPQNYTSASAPSELSGKKRLFLLGRITDAELPHLKAQAYIVGHLYDEPRAKSPVVDRFGRLPWHMEVFFPEIDSFNIPEGLAPPATDELKRLKFIPEEQIKVAFAEIIGEPFIPKDWGGERSDLCSTRVRLQGGPVAAAFVFKGPAKFQPLTVADLGKNGDQISRLFSEPVDLVFVQHCHQITSAVRDHMRAFATRIDRLRPFCLIDGADTVTLLKVHNKLGFS